MATGLDLADVGGLEPSDKILLYGWQEAKAGTDNGRPWLPAAIRRLSIDDRLALAADDDLDAAWVERERYLCATDPAYFVDSYGHLQADEGGAPIPFAMWPAQLGVLDTIHIEPLVVILKARQLGLTWLALHYGYWLQAINPATTNAVILGLSQDGGYAKRLLERARRINDLLPPYLRGAEERKTRDSTTEFKLKGRGRMVSLPGVPHAPRSWQADYALCDEWAFVRNGQAGPTMTALLSTARRIVAVSSGNGPPEEPGWGQHFAQLYEGAIQGRSDWAGIFLPASTHQSRTPEWRAIEEARYDSVEEFLAEQPETDDQALIGGGKDRYFALSDLNAAVALGGELDAMLGTDRMPPPAGEEIHGGIDWGEHTHALAIWPLEAGGIYVPPGETVLSKTSPADAADPIHQAFATLQTADSRTGRPAPPIGGMRFDAAGIQSMRAFSGVAQARYLHQYNGRYHAHPVPFGKYKAETAGHLRRLFRRVGEGHLVGVIAISPTNETLIRQLRALESAPHGWQKADDQHGPDALVAGATRIARRSRT